MPQIKEIDIRVLIESSNQEQSPVVKFDIVKFIKKVDCDKYYKADSIGFTGAESPAIHVDPVFYLIII